MKNLMTLGAVLAMGAALATPAAAATVCLTPHLIDRTKVVDTRTIDFHMRDGKVWRSRLQTPCLGLKFYGFSYVSRADEICGGAQAIHVIKTHETCTLGPFEAQTVGHS
jgi:hypothetical protein